MTLGPVALATVGMLLLSQMVNPQPPGLPDTSRADSAASKSAMMKMHSIVIPKVDFHKAEMPTVLAFLESKSKELDPEHIGVHFVLKSPPLPVETPDGTQLPSARQPALVTLTLTDIPLEDAVDFILSQTDLTCQFVHGVALLSPADTEQERLAKKAAVIAKLRDVIVPSINFEKMDIFDVIRLLNSKSKDLDPDHAGVEFSGYVPEDPKANYSRVVSLILREASLMKILESIHQQTHLDYLITSQGVFIEAPVHR